MQKFATTAPVAASLSVPAGRIQLIAADRTDATVDVRPADPKNKRDVRAAEEMLVSYADGTLRITDPAPKNRAFGPSGSVEVTVQLPAGSPVTVEAADAELRGVGRLGDVALEAARAAVKLDETSAARITVAAGDITLGRLTGPARVRTRMGDITVTDAARGDLDLETAKGDITVATAPGTDATLDAGTSYGRVANSLTYSGGTPAVTVRATTAYGDITARSN
ncbi:DUF4097 family beta strand repeat protein [Streptomyces sp. SID5785]|uniref:DUF4097 family beta strand repeat-containing protein n=1 Tax=Streptomyces sp. SID5785 TaxID=2690309 RepID=UPI001360DA8C|nr:DUF4097 family beta strand repeat-containing protein [Streptomyces sp. SID5785]MZD06026.1 DUF4097 family beta strand repeat protein [Streptomyces sp. SID5785]